MNQLSINEFSLLNDDEKLKIFENIQNSIELQKKYYFKNYNEEIPISSYYPKKYFSRYQKENEKNNYGDNDLLFSFSVSSNSNEKENQSNLIKKAKNNVRELKKEIENIKKINKRFKNTKDKNANKLKTNNNDLDNSETIPEVNYIIESTTNSYDSTKKNKPIYNNYIDYSKEYANNINKKKNNINKEKNKHKNNFDFNPNLLNNNILNINLNNIELYKNNKCRNNENHYINGKKSFENNITSKNRNRKNKSQIYEKYFNTFNETINKRKKDSNENNIDKLKVDLKEKFDKVYLFKDKVKNLCLNNNNKYFYNNDYEGIKENFNNYKNIITSKENSKANYSLRKDTHIRNDNKIIRYKSLNDKKRININDISNKLYNMQKIIKDKINKKKQEIEEKEMRNCTFIPKINSKSKKIMEKLDCKNKNLIEGKEESQKYIEKEIIKGKCGIDLIPRYNKSLINHNKGKNNFSKNKRNCYNQKYDELKECTFKPTINKNKSINYFRGANNYQYNTINIQQANNYKDNRWNNNYEKDYFNKPANIKKSFSQLNNQINKYLYKNEKFENSKFSKYNSKENNFLINNTESNNNYSFRDNLSSKKILINNNNKKENAKSLMNIFYNENDTYLYKPQIYKNRKYTKKIFNSRNKEEINQKNEVEELRNLGNKKEIINEYIINRNINSSKPNERKINYENQIEKGKVIEMDDYSSIPNAFLFYPKNKVVYIKKNVKYQRNYSYTNRNNYLNLNDRNKILNNRMVIQKLLQEEEE